MSEVKELANKLLATFFEEFGVDSIATADGKTEGFEALAHVALEYVGERGYRKVKVNRKGKLILDEEEPK